MFCDLSLSKCSSNRLGMDSPCHSASFDLLEMIGKRIQYNAPPANWVNGVLVGGAININDVIEIINDDTIIVMFVTLKKNKILNNNLINKIKSKVKNSLSPRHVPKIILKVSDIPKTRSGKIVELMVKNLINNKKIDNLDSLSNPECIKDYINRKELKL